MTASRRCQQLAAAERLRCRAARGAGPGDDDDDDATPIGDPPDDDEGDWDDDEEDEEDDEEALQARYCNAASPCVQHPGTMAPDAVRGLPITGFRMC